MKNTNIKFISLMNLFKSGVRQDAMVSLCNFIELPALVKQLGWRIIASIFTLQGKVSFRFRQMHNFYNYILRLRVKHGDKYCVNYLKACQLAIQKAIAKDKISSLREINPSYSFPRLASCGLPRYIPLSDRRAIMNRSTTVIRWWLTLYSLYRIVGIPGELKLETITAPFSGDKEFLQKVSLDLKTLVLRSSSVFNKSILKKEKGLQLFESSSPSSLVSWIGIFYDPFQLARAGLGQVMLDYMYTIGYSNLLSYWTKIFKYHGLIEKMIRKEYLRDPRSSWPGMVGKLSTKDEAAGKVRVFAMVDVWTQSILLPLHNMLFDFLGSLPNDGTLNQTAACIRASDKAIKAGCSFGYDLSAATDRLPITLQVSILSSVMGDKLANLWKKLLVDRDYWFRVTDQEGKFLRWEKHRYSVGQPMGALSSWAMLAVTHHFLVQLAYQRAYSKNFHLFNLTREDLKDKWFDGYELLGDDIVIFDKLVASQYLTIMEGIGVPINLSKSVVATNSTLEFAKVTMHYGVNVSALSWKMFISQNNLMGRVNILYSLINKGYTHSKLMVWIDNILRPNLKVKSNLVLGLIPLLAMFNNSGKISTEDVLKAIDTEGGITSSALIRGANKGYLINLISSLTKGIPLRLEKMEWSPRWFLEWLKRSIRNYSDDPFNDSKELALEIVDSVFDFSGREQMETNPSLLVDGKIVGIKYQDPLFQQLLEWKDVAPMPLPDGEKVWDTKLHENSEIKDQFLAMRTSLYNILRDELFSKMDILEHVHSFDTVEQGLRIAEDFDRYAELKTLLLRAKVKIFTEKLPPKLPKLSLKLIKVLLKVKQFKDKNIAINSRNIYLRQPRIDNNLYTGGPRNWFTDK